jgi:hypothetical protein
MLYKTLFATAAFTLLTSHDPLKDLNIGDAFPNAEHSMMDVSGQQMSLEKIAGDNGLLVIFTSNQCPFVVGSDGSEGWDGRYAGLYELAKRSNIGMALINSNHANRAKGESLEDMQRRHKERNFGSYYLLDENNVMADVFAARTTPHVFLFDKEKKLVYKGAIDDSVASAKDVKEHWLKNAMANMVAGKPIEPATTRNIGCSIKRVSHGH